MSWYDYLVHPASGFAAWRDHPPFGMAEMVLLLLSLAWGLTESDFIVLQGTRKLRSRLTPDWANLLAFPVAAQLLWIGASFVMLGILTLFHIGNTFETIFSVLVFGSIPSFIAWIGLVLRGINYVTNRCWQAASLLLLLWTTWLLWTGFRFGCSLNGWQATLAALPMVILLWVIGVQLTLERPPETFQSYYPWRRMRGEHIVVFYMGNKDPQETEEIVKGAEDTLCQLLDLLSLKPLKFRVWLFLCQDEEQHRKLVKGERDKASPLANGYAHHDSISLVYGKWDNISGDVAHEFCHVVRCHRIALKLLGILDEGLATYVAEKLYPGSTTPAITLVPNLQIVANSSVFFEWTLTEKPAMSHYYCYQHAQALADYLISRYGLPRYFELCREVAASKEPTEGRKLAAAVEKVYESPLTQVERSWRKTWPQNWRTGQIELDFRSGDDVEIR